MQDVKLYIHKMLLNTRGTASIVFLVTLMRSTAGLLNLTAGGGNKVIWKFAVSKSLLFAVGMEGGVSRSGRRIR